MARDDCVACDEAREELTPLQRRERIISDIHKLHLAAGLDNRDLLEHLEEIENQLALTIQVARTGVRDGE